jgi:hypothetical protein
MRLGAALLLAALGGTVAAQPLPDPGRRDDKPGAQQTAPAPPAPPKPRPRITLKPRGGTGANVGDDAPGGGATSAAPSKGGNAGTPSGSFTGPPPKP